MIKKSLALLLTLMLIISMLPMNVFAVGIETDTETDVEEEVQPDNTKIETEFDSFYPAKVGNKFFASLQAAINAAAEGATVVVLDNITLTEQLTIAEGKIVTLDLNGKTVNGAYNGSSTTNHIYALSNSGDLTITDSKGGGSINSRGVYNYGTLTLEGGTIAAVDGNGGYAVNNEPGSTFVMNGGKVAATYEDGDAPAAGNYDATALDVPADCEATLNGGEITSVTNFTFAINLAGKLTVPATSTVEVIGAHGAISMSGGEADIDGGTFICSGVAGQTDNVVYVTGGKLDISGGTFTHEGDKVDADSGAAVVMSGNSAELTVSGGSFTGLNGSISGNANTTLTGGSYDTVFDYEGWDDIKAYVPEGSTVTIEGESFTKVSPYVAQIGETGYETLQAAVDAAGEGDEIVLVADVTPSDTLIIAAGKTVTLDLNGKTISQAKAQTEAYSMIKNSGTLTIKDSVGSGKISYQCTTVGGNYVSNTISNHGVLNVEGGTIESLSALCTEGYPHAIDTYPGSVTNITGGVVASENYDAIRLFCNSADNATTVNISGGTIINRVTFQQPSNNFVANGVLNITGGTFESTTGKVNVRLLAFGSDCTKMAGSISGGTFDTGVGVSNYTSEATIEWKPVSGGTFSTDVSDYCADGFECKANADGSYGIVAAAYVAEVNGVKFESVLEALDYAIENAASELKLLADSREVMPTDIEIVINADLKITADAPVSAKFYNNGTSYDFIINSNNNNTFTIGENVTFQLEDRVIWAGYYGNNVTVVVEGTLAGYQYWHGADTTVTSTGTLKTTGEALVMRRGATLSVDGGKVEANYFNILAGNIFAENDAEIKCGAFWISNTGAYAGEGNVSISIWDSTLTSSGNLKSESTHDAGVSIDIYDSVVSFADFDSYGACVLDANTTLGINGADSSLTVKNLVNNGTVEIYDEGSMTATGTVTNNNVFTVESGSNFEGNFVNNVKVYVAEVNGEKYTDLQEAIKAAAPSGTVELLCDVTVDKWIMISETLTIGDGTVITLDMNGLTIDGNGYTLTVNDIESANNGNHLFYDGDYNIKDLTINMADNVNGLGITSGTISNVTFNGGRSASGGAAIQVSDGVITGVHAGNVTIEGCTFNNNGGAIYFETAQNGLVVDNNTFNSPAGANVIIMRGTETFTNNTVVSGRTVNVVSGSPVVSGNDFGDVRLKVYNEATATIENNVINNLAFNDATNTKSTFVGNTLSETAQEALDAVLGLNGSGTAEDPYIINNFADLKRFRDMVNGGTTFDNEFVKLATDIDLAGEAWTSIGTTVAPFKGTFDGGNFTVSNLVVSGTNNVGFFGYADGCSIKNLKLNNVSVTGANCVGAIAGQVYSTSTIDNCHVSGSIKIEGQTNVGGIVGKYYVKVSNSSVIGDGVDTSYIKGVYTEADLEGDNVGGIMGHGGEDNNFVGNTVKNITISGTRKVGGIVGTTNRSTDLDGCVVENVAIKTTATAEYAAGNTSSMDLGGLIGHYYNSGNGGKIENVTVSGVAFETNGLADAGAIVGGDRSTPDAAPVGVTASNVTISNVTGATQKYLIPVAAQIGEETYATLAEAVAAAQAGDEIVLLADVTLSAELTLPAGITLNGNGKQIDGSIVAGGDLTFVGHTKVTSFNAGYNKPTITIGEGACLEMNGPGRMVIGHGATFNITGTITDAKNADKATIQPSLIVAAGASFTGNGLNFNVTNAYVKFNGNSTSKNSSANGTFNFNINNSIWEQTGVLAFYVPTSGKDPTFNLTLKDSVLNSTSHLVFSVTKGEIVFDNSNVNVGTSRQIENRSILIVKNGSVVNGAVATSSNAINPGTIIVENATYAVTGQFSGSTVGTGTLIIKKGATVSVGSIVDKANIVIDATGMTADDVVNFTGNLSKFTGTTTVVNNEKLEAKIVDGKIVLAVKPVAKIGEQTYETLAEAITAAQEGDTINILAGTIEEGTIKLPATLKNVTFKGAADHASILKDMTITAADGNSIDYQGLTFDGIVFDNSNITITGWRSGTEIVKDLTVKNCIFKNIVRTGNMAAVHLNADPVDEVSGFTFTNNVIDSVSGSSNSGIYCTGMGGDITVANNTFNSVTFRPFILTVQNADGVADNVTITGNTFSGSSVGRLQVLGTNSAGTDSVAIVTSNNIIKDITNDFQICYWKFNPETTTVDLSKNYYDIDVESNPGLFYYNGSAADNVDLYEMGVFPVYTELNEDGTIKEESAYTPELTYVAQVGEVKYFNLDEAVAAVKATGGTLMLLADANESITFNWPAEGAPTEITFDLNGFTITSAESTLWVSDGYKVTVKDSSDAKTGKLISTNTGGEAIAITRNGHVVLESGYVYNDFCAVWMYNATENGTFVMNGGTLEVPNGGQTLSVGAGKATINAGKILCNKIPGGGGWNTLVYANGALEITGGEFLGTIGTNGGPISISGGTFSYCDDANDGFRNEHLATGYSTKVNADGSITVYALPTSLSGSGTEEDPFLINNVDDLKFFRDSVNNGTRYNGQFVKLNADIDLNEEEWTPIGDRNVDQGSFLGTFDGGNHTISNLWISQWNKTGAGFFSKVGLQSENVSGTVKNVTFDNVTIISSQSYVGVIAQAPSGALIENVHITGDINISGCGYVGGIVGHGYPTINDSSVKGDGTITANYWGAGAILGFAGDYGAKISNATVEGVKIHATSGGAASVAGSPYGATVNGATVSNVEITSDSDYCMGYVAGGGKLSNVTINNVTATANGQPITPTDAVASIGENVYFTLKDALAVLQANGGTLELLADASINASVVVLKDTVINGNGKKLTVTGAYGIDVKAGVNLAINNLTVESNLYALNLRGASDNAEVTITDSNLTGCIALNVWGKNVIINATNSAFTSVDTATHENYSAIVLNNNGAYSAENTVITITGGSITALDENDAPSIAIRNATATGVANVSNTTVVTGEISEVVAIVTYNGYDEFYSYLTLQAAIEKAENDPTATVKLLKDITISEKLVIEGNVTIDGNGKTITYTGTDRAIDVPNTASGANVTIKNLTLAFTGGYSQRGINYNTNGKLILDNVTVNGTNVTYAVNMPSSSANAEVEINNSSITGLIALNVWGANAKVYATNSHFTSVDANSAENYAAVKLNNNGTDSAEGATITINGGSITAKDENGNPSSATTNATATGVITISDTTVVIGNHQKNVAAVLYSGASEFYGCFTLQEAVDKATNDPKATVKLLRDITISEKLVIEGNVTIDGNGKTITYTGSDRIMDVAAANVKLTLKDINLVSSASYCQRGINIGNNVDLTLDNVSVKGTNVTYALNLAGTSDNAKVTITDSDLAGCIALNVWGKNVVVNATNSEFVSVDTATHENYAAIVLNNNGAYSAENTVITITGGSITALDENDAPSIAIRNATATGVANVSNTTVVTGEIREVVAIVTYNGYDEFYSHFTLQDAINKAENDPTATVKLLKDITISEKLVIEGNVTIDGNDKTITYTGTDRAIDVPNTANGANVTIKNLTVVAEDAERVLNYNTNGSFTVENVTVTGGSYAINFPSSADNATVSITDSELTALIALNIWGSDMEINVTNSELYSLDDSTQFDYSTIQLNRDEYGNIADGTTVTVTGGKLSAVNEKNEPNVVVSNWTSTGTVTISSTTEVIGTVKNAVAMCAGACFYTLQDAIDEVVKYNYNAPIVLIRDIALTEGVTVPAGANITIDLNGKTISGTDTTNKSFGLITNKGNLTVKDSVGTGKITLIATQDNGYNRYSSVISNTVGGKLTVESGTIEHLGGHTMAYAIDNLTNGKGTYAETVINGGTVKSSYVGIRQFLNGVEADNILTVNGGTVTGNNTSIFFQDPSANCNSGKLVVGENATLGNRIYVSGTAGTPWDVELSVSAQALGTYGITTDEIPETCLIKEVNGIYGFIKAVASVNGIGYETLADAVAAAEAGDTVELLTDVALTAPLTIKKGITIDGKNNKITQADECNNNIALLYFEDAGDVTVKNVVFDGLKTGAAIRTLRTNITIDNCVFQNCEHTVGQGLVRLTMGSAVVKNSKFLNNDCSMGISFNWDAADDADDTLLVENCVFEGNTANKTALIYYVKGSACTLKDNSFVDNTVNCNANGAVVYMGFTENNVITGNLFRNNVVTEATASTRVAGAIFFGYETEISDNVFINNTATNANGDTLGQICTSTYYECEIDLSGNYWGGEEPVYGKDYTIQHQTGDADFVLENYWTEYDATTGELTNLANTSYKAQLGKVPYTSLSSALKAAKAGDTVTLVSDVDLGTEYLRVKASVTLDLNGYTLTTQDMAIVFGSIVDNGTTKGLLAVDKDLLVMTKASYPMLPVWNEAQTGYVFVSVNPQMVLKTESDSLDTVPAEDGFVLKLRPSIAGGRVSSIDVFKDGALDNGITFMIKIHCIRGNEDPQAFEFVVKEDLIKEVYSNGKMIKLTVVGASDAFERYDIEFLMISDTGVTYSSMADGITLSYVPTTTADAQ